MANQEEEFLLREKQGTGGKLPLFGPADGKILATGDMFRGPYTGITSDIDLNNPGNRLQNKKNIPD
ncbi:hypothetical protein LCM00_24315 [Bacillus infantis]|uniref:hypothetical protein n=1 Tax=Bacillus infantis TaxID=324767 RepID=UPI001CD28A36|nr:hypothetical protein [Bacillus infantis]MCA1042613.1 hypothetical protein [Bacillus infantis]